MSRAFQHPGLSPAGAADEYTKHTPKGKIGWLLLFLLSSQDLITGLATSAFRAPLHCVPASTRSALLPAPHVFGAFFFNRPSHDGHVPAPLPISPSAQSVHIVCSSLNHRQWQGERKRSQRRSRLRRCLSSILSWAELNCSAFLRFFYALFDYICFFAFCFLFVFSAFDIFLTLPISLRKWTAPALLYTIIHD